MIYLLTAIGLTPGGSSTVHIYTQTVHRTTQNKQYVEQHNNLGESGPCPVLASYNLAFALQLRKKHGKNLSHGKISDMFRIVCDPSSGSIELYLTEIIRSGSLMFVVCLVGVWQRNFEPVVCVCVCVVRRPVLFFAHKLPA